MYAPMPKKEDARIWSNNRTIALIAHAIKVMLKVIQHSGSCKLIFLEKICIRQSGSVRAKQDMERQRYNNYNNMQNSKCISSPSSAVWL